MGNYVLTGSLFIVNVLLRPETNLFALVPLLDQNILLSSQGGDAVLKIADFGLSR